MRRDRSTAAAQITCAVVIMGVSKYSKERAQCALSMCRCDAGFAAALEEELREEIIEGLQDRVA